jgi:hypothetical protein
MHTRPGPAAAACALLIALLTTVAGCSSDSDPAGDPRPSGPTDGASTPGKSSSSGPGVAIVGEQGSARYCVEARARLADWLYSGIRLRSAEGATVTKVSGDLVNVEVTGAWIAGGGASSSGAFVPWAQGDDVLGEIDWADRVDAEGAELEPGEDYTLVLRLQPDTDELPASVQNLNVAYDGGELEASVTSAARLEFQRSC